MKNKRFLTVLIASAILVLGLSACGTIPAAQATTGGNVTTRTLNVAGQGRVAVTPDLAYVNIGVRSEGAEVAGALNANTEAAQKVAEALIGLGVDPKDIQTTNFNIYPQQNFGPNGEVLETKYVVDNMVYVTVRDLTRLGELLDTVVRSGANTINGINFDISNEQAVITEARKLAIEDAKRQASELASAAGVTLGELQSINVFNSGGPVPVYDAKMGIGQAGGSSVPISAGQMIITVDANLSYEIK
jgi:uncharacterized protein YggE